MLKYVAIFVFFATLAACQSQRITMTETQIPQDPISTEVVKEVEVLPLLDLPVQENNPPTELQTQMSLPPVVDSEMKVNDAVDQEEPSPAQHIEK